MIVPRNTSVCSMFTTRRSRSAKVRSCRRAAGQCNDDAHLLRCAAFHPRR